MKRSILTSLVITCIATLATAQGEKPTTVVKSGSLQMKAADEKPINVLILAPATAKGDFDVPPAHPECAEREGQESLDCTSVHIQRSIARQLGEPSLNMEQWGSSVVGVTFNINQYGELKDVRVDHSGDGTLSQQVMLALYDLPKFEAATKDGNTVHSSMQVNYRYEDLYRK
jgi:hypothetical protein